ncbi:protein EFR3 homolog B-like isoform X2 [Acanthaster planci]|uniref:Protein EFR3 homolog B-like isoform X2 n=1 Tax=Acanthaster planci TaxID=133434 RepID=A0A8B7YBG8_ACAPL|nr:protein EFR3 homolog B-like isoform X2 [Acanthaster planci]
MPGLFTSMTHYVYAGCCNCLSSCKPRYKRLVDSIFPANPEDGLVRNNMERLTFYAVSHNEKLDRIGGYLAHRLDRDVYRQRIGYVVISMQALDQLLLACHAQSLNLFVESFLRMVHKLLESNTPELQILGTNSFVKFSQIEEDTPSYHRTYDFFISKFASMCHNNSDHAETRRKIRLAGLKGLQGVVRKTVSDELQVNIWDTTYMDKIVPSFLFNMSEGFDSHESPVHEHPEERPEVLADSCLRDVMRRAAYANIHTVIKPVLKHLDLHELWVPNNFAIKVFKGIMYSIQSQYRYVTPHFLLLHLDEHMKNTPRIKRSIVEVLKEIVAIAADGAVGPSVLEIFNTLLRHLRLSVDERLSGGQASATSSSAERSAASAKKTKKKFDENEEILFEEAIIDTIGAFASILPDYQKIEIMMFIMGKVPMPRDRSSTVLQEEDHPLSLETKGEGDILVQDMLLKSLLEVGTKYTTVSMATTFPASFFQPLLNMSVIPNPGIRVIVQEILHTLVDRHENVIKLYANRGIVKNIADLELKCEKPSRQDIMFMRKHGAEFQWHIFENLIRAKNTTKNFVAIYCTMALLCVELGTDDVLVDLVKLALALQDHTCEPNAKLPLSHLYAIHAIVAQYLNLIGQLTAIPSLCQHISQVIEERRKSAPFLLPPINVEDKVAGMSPSSLAPELLFHVDSISEALASSGHDVTRLSVPYIHVQQPQNVDSRPRSLTEVGSINVDFELLQASPTPGRKRPPEEVTFESLKQVLISGINDSSAEDERQRRLDVLHSFRNSTLDELAAAAETRNEKWQQKLNDILETVTKSPQTPAGSPTRPDPSTPLQFQSIPTYEMKFPELCVY